MKVQLTICGLIIRKTETEAEAEAEGMVSRVKSIGKIFVKKKKKSKGKIVHGINWKIIIINETRESASPNKNATIAFPLGDQADDLCAVRITFASPYPLTSPRVTEARDILWIIDSINHRPTDINFGNFVSLVQLLSIIQCTKMSQNHFF